MHTTNLRRLIIHIEENTGLKLDEVKGNRPNTYNASANSKLLLFQFEFFLSFEECWGYSVSANCDAIAELGV